jgi:hypothetical protein
MSKIEKNVMRVMGRHGYNLDSFFLVYVFFSKAGISEKS